jgi:tRNA 5-methylaminomethyl-2-thiouridine biosynthesis bifunctional protein
VQPATGADGASPPDLTLAHWAPRHTTRHSPRDTPGSPALARGARTAQPQPQKAVVVGAGVAGAAAALALARLGVAVTVLDRHSAPATEASGNPAGLVHGTVYGDDGTYARLFRAAALQAGRSYAEGIAQDPHLGRLNGLLRLAPGDGDPAALQATLDRQGLPADWVQAVDAGAASACAQVPLTAPAWRYPGGGWIEPARWVHQVLAHPNVQFQGGAAAARISFEDGLWTVWDAAAQALASAPVLVLACTATVPRLLEPWTAAAWPLDATRGQVTRCAGSRNGASPTTALRCAVAGDGYAIPLLDGSLLCGATRVPDTLAAMQAAPDISADVKAAAHQHNLDRLERLTGLQAPADQAPLQGRSGWRLHSDDRLPIAGAVPLRDGPPGQRRDQARLLPRVQGLFVLTALGARGLTLAPLLGRLVAAQATGTPWPLEQDLADAVDPARWRVRAARRDQAGA